MPKAKVISIVVATLAIASLSSNSSSELIDKGRYTADTVSGLDWLDLSYTLGRSYNSVANGLGGFIEGGWRIATTAEVDDLFSRATQASEGVTVSPSDYYDSTVALIQCLSPTFYSGIEGSPPPRLIDGGAKFQRVVAVYNDGSANQIDDPAGRAGLVASPDASPNGNYVRWTTDDNVRDSFWPAFQVAVLMVRESNVKGGKKCKATPIADNPPPLPSSQDNNNQVASD